MSREMVRGDGHPLLYRRIADKHRESFRAYLPVLLARREEDIATMRGHVHDMELDQHRWLGPEVARAADDVAVLERRARQQQDQQRREQEIAGLASALEQARAAEVDAAATIAALRSERVNFEAALDHSRGEAADAHRQVEAFRASLSWRATAPLRVLYDWLRSIWN
jgi:chromosome segregation ATPase